MNPRLIQELRSEAKYLAWAKHSSVIQLLRSAADRIKELEKAIEDMRVAGGRVEFQAAFDRAKALLEKSE